MRKKIAAAIVTALAATILVPASTFAVAPETDITGTVTSHNTTVNGATVTVHCNSSSGTDTTDASGAYLVVFAAADCPSGATVSVAASKNSQSGHNSGTAGAVTTKLNIALVDVSVVPEYGLIGLMGATLIGGGAFLVIRRRQISGHQV
ncbi:MAG TPA: hypothetical protein VHC21_04555 [Candidatus Saccharimonadales bacterium]|nr:hypothetical protein [Candidatus Saccharimonadales bacterium]